MDCHESHPHLSWISRIRRVWTSCVSDEELLASPRLIPLLKLLSLVTRSCSNFFLNMFFLVVSRNESWRSLFILLFRLAHQARHLVWFPYLAWSKTFSLSQSLIASYLFGLVNDHRQWLDLISLILSLIDSRRSDLPFVLSAMMGSKFSLTWNPHCPTAEHSLVVLVVLIFPYVWSDCSMISLISSASSEFIPWGNLRSDT